MRQKSEMVMRKKDSMPNPINRINRVSGKTRTSQWSVKNQAHYHNGPKRLQPTDFLLVANRNFLTQIGMYAKAAISPPFTRARRSLSSYLNIDYAERCHLLVLRLKGLILRHADYKKSSQLLRTSISLDRSRTRSGSSLGWARRATSSGRGRQGTRRRSQ